MLTHVQYGILKLTPSTCSDRSRVPDKRRVPDTGRGSRQIVLIEAGGFYPGIYGTQYRTSAAGAATELRDPPYQKLLIDLGGSEQLNRRGVLCPRKIMTHKRS